MLSRYGAIRLQYSVYEVNNTKRVIDNIIVKIENLYAKEFSGADSVIIFLADNDKLIKYGNAIHRDTDVVYF
jgi:CRISPR-associated protein Cas2